MCDKCKNKNEPTESDSGMSLLGGLIFLGLAAYGLSKIFNNSTKQLERDERDILTQFAEEEFHI